MIHELGVVVNGSVTGSFKIRTLGYNQQISYKLTEGAMPSYAIGNKVGRIDKYVCLHTEHSLYWFEVTNVDDDVFLLKRVAAPTLHEFGVIYESSPASPNYYVQLKGYGKMQRYWIEDSTRPHLPDGSFVSGIDKYVVIATEDFIYWYEVTSVDDDGTINLKEL